MNYTNEVEDKLNKNIEMLLISFLQNKMELPSKLLEQIAFNTRSKKEEHVLIVMSSSIHEEHLAQSLQIKVNNLK